MHPNLRQNVAFSVLLTLLFGLPLLSTWLRPAHAAAPHNLTPFETPPIVETEIGLPPPIETPTPPAATDTLVPITHVPTEDSTEIATSFATLDETAATAEASATPTPWPTPTTAEPATAEPSTTPTLGAPPSPTLTTTPTPTFVAAPAQAPQDVVINEVAWAGTAASTADEWLELYNTTGSAIDLTGWTLSDGGDIAITLNGTLSAGGYYLLERTDDTTVSDIPANQIYTGGLANTGETLTLRDALGNVVDTANGDGGPWPGGASAGFYSMERSNSGPDSDGNWCSNDGVTRNGLDATGNPLNATPRQSNSGCALPTPTATPGAYPPGALLINEVAWAGTAASINDEWLELYNPGGAAIDLSGWILSDGGDIAIALNGSVGPGAYFLLERTDDTTVNDIPADFIYTGGLNNTGEVLTLYDPLSNVIDTANGNGGPWPGGVSSGFYSMERTTNGPDSDSNWCSNDGLTRNGADATGNPLNATPRQPNSACLLPTPTATQGTYPPGAILINEVAWAGTAASTSDEWLELYNPGSAPIDLSGWTLSDGGDINLTLNSTLNPGGYLLLERTSDATVSDIPADQTYTGGLSNTGETLTLRDSLGNVIDTANNAGGAWPAGNATGFYSMERLGTGDVWCTNDGLTRNGLDATGNPLNATPRQPNSNCTAPTPTATGTLTVTLTPAPPLAIVINEVAWAGTAANSADEWIELHNPTSAAINLSGWLLTDGGDIAIALNGTVSAGGYFLLERTDNNTVSDIPADQLYTGGLNNTDEVLTLYDALSNVIDTANSAGGAWPGGDATTSATLERLSAGPDTPGNWQTHNGYCRIGRDANGALLRATARAANSQTCPLPTAEPVPSGLRLNEFLPHPASGSEEFIEVINLTGAAFDLSGYQLDDAEGGSAPYVLPVGTVLQPGAIVAFGKATTGITLNDDGDTARLLTPNGTLVDAQTYYRDPGTGHSWARLPDGGGWSDQGDPTPGGSNRALPAPTAQPVYPIGEVRHWNAGAWATIIGRITVPPNTFSKRVIYIQDETGGIALYLGRGEWPALKLGQQVQVFGYMRPRNGEAQLYVRNVWPVHAGPETDIVYVLPRPATTGEFGEGLEGLLVTMRGTVVKLEAQGFWFDDGSGAARVFFAAATGVKRPPVKRGEVWVITGVMVENTTASAASPRYRLQIRFASDYLKVTDAAGNVLLTPTPALNDVVENPTEEPTATASP